MLGAVPRRYRRWVAIALCVAGPLMFAYVLAYGTTHPLGLDHEFDTRPHTYKPGKVIRYELFLENGGQFAVSDISIARLEGSPALQLERVGIETRNDCVVPAGHKLCWPPLHPLGDYVLRSGTDPIILKLRQGGLCPPGVAKLDAIWVRYTVLGMRHEQRVALEQPPRVRCP